MSGTIDLAAPRDAPERAQQAPRLCTSVHYRSVSEPEACIVGTVIGVIDGMPVLQTLRVVASYGGHMALAETARPADHAPQGRGTWHYPYECPETR